MLNPPKPHPLDAIPSGDLLEELARRAAPISLTQVFSAWAAVAAGECWRFDAVAQICADLNADYSDPRGQGFIERDGCRYLYGGPDRRLIAQRPTPAGG